MDFYTNTAVGTLSVGVEPADINNSLAACATMLIDYGVPGVPVEQNERYVGMVYEGDLLAFRPEGELASAESAMRTIEPILHRAPISEALRRFDQESVSALAVVDDEGRILGVVTPSRIFATTDRNIRPKLVGGLATPFGVRLLGGGVTGGASNWQIVATGAAMFTTFIVASYIVLAIAHLLPDRWLAQSWSGSAFHFAELFLFLVLLRLQPLSGYHAAEHMVVHAIEQGEPLEPEAVRRMSRVHPRCGTNIAVALGLFLGIFSLNWLFDQEVRVLIGLLTALFFFRPIGTFVQRAFTTRPPNSEQLAAGIKAGQELLERYQTQTPRAFNGFTRLWQSGMLHAIAGSTLAGAILALLFEMLRLPPDWRVF